jgi:transposase
MVDAVQSSSSSTQEKATTLVGSEPVIRDDNARPHTVDAVKDLLCRWRWEILEHPPYSPDMSPHDYDLFAKMKEPLRGTRYSTRQEIIRAVGRSQKWTPSVYLAEGGTNGGEAIKLREQCVYLR